jgi:hypothetical protein
VTIILYTDTKTSLVDEHLGLEKITKKHLLKSLMNNYLFCKKYKLAAVERVSDQAEARNSGTPWK